MDITSMTNSFWKFFTSLRLTVVLLGLAVVLVFLGTVAQVNEGLWNAQTRWFRHVIVTRVAGDPWWVPPVFPGGYLIGIMLLLNLIAAHIKRFKFTWRQAGINLTHLGVILLLVGQLATDMLSRESNIFFNEGEAKSFSEDAREWELAFIKSVDDKKDEVVAIPTAMLKPGAELRDPKLPFPVTVRNFWPNSELSFRAPTQQNSPPLTDKGIAKDWDFTAQAEVKGMDQRNMPTAVVDLGERGTWVVPSWASEARVIEGVKEGYKRSVGPDVASSIAATLAVPQEIQTDGGSWRMALRSTRYYKEFSVKLLNTTHDVYPGTNIPKNYQSRVEVNNPANGEKREVDISMNNPFRYEGLTFYQSQMDRFTRPGFSGLQVVRNPSWLTPYLGCFIVGLGMCWQFFYHLNGFISKRRTTTAVTA